MNCQEAIERLPWWLNGSLEPEERREVEEHLAGCDACRQALGETRLAWEVFDQHIPSEALVAYAFDEAPEGIDPALFERHLAGCPQCAAELEMVRASRLLGEREEVAILAPRSGSPAAPERPRRRERGWQAAALAAGLTSVIAIGGWLRAVESYRQTPRQGSAVAAAALPPLLSPTTAHEITPLDTRGQAQPTVLAVADTRATLVLDPTRGDTFKKHSAELLDSQGRRLGSLELASAAAGPAGAGAPVEGWSINLEVRRLTPGEYAIQVYGTDGAAPVPTGRYPFTVR
ncbi:MAG TPA: zf-HC2 domain-containing protein [Thermoanaerobaculia bacterium]|nr:zf-HC2 domain-containing protein [Thermoanaerobaculia bacterium]